jgi:GR25 family glycosyltransferase involved in LPS biosynthesis
MLYKNGLNNFSKIYYINLDHRKDRFTHITNELSKTNIELHKIHKISGIYLKEFGILGCAKSHCLALEAFIKSNEDNCIIFEDDFEFTETQEIINVLIDRVFNELIKFDVLMLASNILNSRKTDFNFITKIIDAQTLSGYAVSKKFAPILLNNYKESISLLEKAGCKTHPFCFDIYMKRIQPYYNWYCLVPKIGKQIESYSDIENAVVAYDC